MGLEETPKKFDFTGELAKRKKLLIIAGIVLLVIAIVVGTVIVLAGGKKEEQTSQESQTEEQAMVEEEESEPEPILETSYLTGEAIDPEIAKKRPLAIMVENHTSSRPPTGLIEADIVYEVPVEAGITRFLAIYQQNAPVKVGPERSARVYFLEWVKEYDAVYAHIGQDPKVLTLIRPYGIDDLRDTGAWWDAPETGRKVEHRAYTSAQKLWEVAAEKGWAEKDTFDSWSYKEDAPLEDRSLSQHIAIDYSSQNYLTEWAYAPDTNTYLRSDGDLPHTDASNDQQISAKNIVVEYLSIWLREGDEKGRRDMKVVGDGDLIVFRDGVAIKGKWSKESREARTKLTDLDGNTIELDPGKTWVQIVPAFEDIVTYETQERPLEDSETETIETDSADTTT